MAKVKAGNQEKKVFKGFHGPWISPYDDSFEEEENDWFSYLHRNVSQQAGKDSPFPDSSWSYARGDSTFEEDHSGKGPKGWKRSDEQIQDLCSEALYHSPEVDASDIEVIVLNGVVSLTGSVSSRNEKKEAQRLLEYIPGVWDVQNQLVINMPI
jgi:osmotically-inducible protein OsmY